MLVRALVHSHVLLSRTAKTLTLTSAPGTAAAALLCPAAGPDILRMNARRRNDERGKLKG